MDRRSFIRNTALISAASYYPLFINTMRKAAGLKNKRIIIIQLSGGNDGLNTVIPYSNDEYYKLRPSLGLNTDEILKLNKDLGVHHELKILRELYENNELSIVNSVGYPNPVQSHFRSMDIWHSASDSSEYRYNGWLGRYLDHSCQDENTPNAHLAIQTDQILNLALQGERRFGLAIKNNGVFKQLMQDPHITTLAKHNKAEYGEAEYLYKILSETVESSAAISQSIKLNKAKQDYGQSQIGQQLKFISNIILSGAETEIFYASHGGFDTHINQKGTQKRLFKQLNKSLSGFVHDLKANSEWNNSLIMVFSEFGRRVAQNGSKGSDHGTANNVFLLGGQIKQAGFYNQGPDLINLHNGNLQHQVDFRSIYAEILDRHMNAPSEKILGRKFEKLGII